MAPDPANWADLPATWLPEATQAPVEERTPRQQAYDRQIRRRIKNNQHQKVLMLAELLVAHCQRIGMRDEALIRRASENERFWRMLCEVAGKQPPKMPDTKELVILRALEMLRDG